MNKKKRIIVFSLLITFLVIYVRLSWNLPSVALLKINFGWNLDNFRFTLFSCLIAFYDNFLLMSINVYYSHINNEVVIRHPQSKKLLKAIFKQLSFYIYSFFLVHLSLFTFSRFMFLAEILILFAYFAILALLFLLNRKKSLPLQFFYQATTIILFRFCVVFFIH